MDLFFFFYLPLKITKTSKHTHGNLLPMAMVITGADSFGCSAVIQLACIVQPEQVQVGGHKTLMPPPSNIHHLDGWMQSPCIPTHNSSEGTCMVSQSAAFNEMLCGWLMEDHVAFLHILLVYCLYCVSHYSLFTTMASRKMCLQPACYNSTDYKLDLKSINLL